MLLNNRRYFPLLVGALFFIVFFYSFDGVSHSRRVIFQVQSAADSSSLKSLLHDILVDGYDVQLGDEFVELTKLCDETVWTKDLWLHCHSHCGDNGTSVCGGLNNARNRIQTCVRLAIDAGMGLILPSAMTRDEAKLTNTGKVTVSADKFWNIERLQTILKKSCPQLKLRRNNDRSGIDTIIDAPLRLFFQEPYTRGTFRHLIQQALQDSDLGYTEITHPVAVSFGDSYTAWNYKNSSESSTIRKALFKSLNFNQNLLALSSRVLESPKLQGGSFIGVHLRGEPDWPIIFGSAAVQRKLYKEAIEKLQRTSPTPIKTVYVSCGNSTAIERFRKMLSPLGYTVHDKWTILADDPETLAKVEALAFDEKAIVEYQTLVEAKYFMGIIMSSMSSLIAFARTVDEEEDFFETHVFPGSIHQDTGRLYPQSPKITGDNFTMLMVTNGTDIMESFP